MKVLWNGQIIAQAPKEDLIYIEGNWYFPPDSVKSEYFKPTETHTHCPWKGDASYYDIVVDGQINKDAAWCYPSPFQAAFERTKKDFTNYVAFWRGVEVTD